MKKSVDTLLFIILLGSLILAPVNSVFADDAAKSAERKSTDNKQGDKKKAEEEPECD